MKAIKKSFSGIALLALFLTIVIAGCNNASTDQQANQAAADTLKKEITLSPESQSLLYQFPTPFEVTLMLEKAKAGFIFDITNAPDNLGKYVTEKSKAINLGVYSADMSYSATYNRVDETNKFLACTSKLADELGIAGVYDQTMLERIKKFNNNKDSLVGMINKLFSNTNDFLSKNNRNQIAVLIATGGFVEGLYLAASLSEVAKDNKLIVAVILKQKENLDKLLTILEAYKMDENMAPIFEQVNKLKAVFTDYGMEAGKKLPAQKSAEVSDLTESVRIALTK